MFKKVNTPTNWIEKWLLMCTFVAKMESMQNKLVFRRCLCLLVMMVAWVGQFHAQVRGTVTDSLTHEPISFVQVYYEGSSIGTQTDTITCLPHRGISR